ncbi:MAG: IPT/TIG domain-containing protein, partial [Acidobacteriota bacterium]
LGPDVITCSKTGTISVNNPIPTLTSISPLTGPTQGPAFTLTVNGTNFVSNSQVRWKGTARETTFVSGAQLKAAILSSDLTTAGTAAVTVFNPGPGGGASSGINFTISNPPPTITIISPNNVVVGSPAFTLEIEGLNFISTSVVRWNGVPRATDFAGSSLLTIDVLASDIATAGTANVTVNTPAPGGGTTGAAVFTINNPVPELTSFVPNATQGGGPAFTMTVNGSNFVNGSIVNWNGAGRPTTFVSSSEIKAEISTADIASGGERTVTVFNPSPGGGLSNAGVFAISNPPPTIGTLAPSTATAGSNAFVLTVTGANFNASSVVRWKGSDRPTVFVNATTVTANIPASDIVTPGASVVTVFNPPPDGGVSNGLTFTVTNPVPVLTSVEPDRIVAGSSDILITINGSNFVGNSIVRWNGQNRVTTVVGTTQLKVVILGSDLVTVGQGLVTVFNPAPEGGTSVALPFTIFPPNPSPVITSLSKTIEVAGAPAFVLTVKGANFIASSAVLWNGLARTTTFVSATELNASIPAADIASAGVAQVSISTPAPGGGTTNPLAFTIATPLATVSAASFTAGPIAAGSIVAGFGSGLAVGTAVAGSSPLPTLLLGTYIEVKDSAGVSRQAPLFFVSPGQINFLIPTQTAVGPATIDVTSGDGKVSRGTIQIAPAALSLFSASSDGRGAAAANVVRVVGGNLFFEDVAQFVDGAWVAKCFGLGPATESVFLALYGTGLGGNGAGLTLTATIGGVATPVPFAGSQGSFVGLDQLNVGPIPRQLIGAGLVDVIVSVNGVAINTVNVCIN